MANKEEIKKVEGAEEEAEKNTKDKKDDEAKKKEADKEFALIRWAKAIGQGVANTAKAVNGFVHNHPYITAGITTAAGYGAKMAVDYFTGSDSEVETHESSEVLSLPEPEDEYTLDDMPEDMEEEVTEDNTNVD